MACLDGEGHQRAQLAFYLQMNRLQTLRFVQTLVAKGFAAEDKLEDQKVCRIFNRRIYRALGAEGIRHRRVASSEILFRRLLSLDYVLEHTGMPWLPTEAEQVRAFEALGINLRLLPLRVYRGAVGETRHYFPLKLPIALEPGRAVFAYIDPGMSTRSSLHCWGQAHRQLWDKLRQAGRTVELFAVAWDRQHLDRTQRLLQAWINRDPAAAKTEAAGLRQAIADADWDTVERYGGHDAVVDKIRQLGKGNPPSTGGGMIDNFRRWGSELCRQIGAHSTKGAWCAEVVRALSLSPGGGTPPPLWSAFPPRCPNPHR